MQWLNVKIYNYGVYRSFYQEQTNGIICHLFSVDFPCNWIPQWPRYVVASVPLFGFFSSRHQEVKLPTPLHSFFDVSINFVFVNQTWCFNASDKTLGIWNTVNNEWQYNLYKQLFTMSALHACFYLHAHIHVHIVHFTYDTF